MNTDFLLQPPRFALPLLFAAAGVFAPVQDWWREAKGWTLMYRGGLLAGTGGVVVFVLWRIVSARRERARLEALVASRTRQLRQSEELFRSIFEHAAVGIYQSSIDGRNLRANPAMARLCGYTDPEEMQRLLTDVATQFYVRDGRREEINAVVARDGAAVDCQSEIRRRDGSSVWVSESVRTVIDPATGLAVYQGSILDITAPREMQAAQEAARLAAEAANAAKTSFLAHMTHELRTPLTGILSNARVALRDERLDETNRARYALIAGSGEHLLALIDEVLDVSRIEAGRLELRPAPFALGDLLGTVAAAFQSRAADGRLEFRCEVDPGLTRFVHGDSLRLRQVLDNLLGNAFEFTARGGVTLRVVRADDGGRFEVEDTGIGIPADQLATVFEPFRQGMQHPGQAHLGGAGLGLHISARLVRAMGGELRVASTPGRGSRFFFELPLPDADGGETLHDGGGLEPPGPGPARAAGSFALPSKEDLDFLLNLSMGGDIVRLRTRLKELAAADPALADFAREVDLLAASFRMEGISELLGRFKAA